MEWTALVVGLVLGWLLGCMSTKATSKDALVNLMIEKMAARLKDGESVSIGIVVKRSEGAVCCSVPDDNFWENN